MDDLPQPYRQPATAARIGLVLDSFARLVRRPLVAIAPGADPIAALWAAPLVVVAHGTQADPVFFFGNRAALTRFECTPAQFIGMPSRFSAEAPDRAERQALLERVTRDGYIADYAGVRISATGHRFRIEQAIVWNLIDADGAIHGQAAAFDHWTEL